MGAFHLLALEDNEEYQKVLRSMLSKYPGRSRLDVDIISGVITFEALMASDDRIDIFITDIDLGEGNPSGIELVRRYFPAGSPTKVIYISGHVEFCTSVYQTEHTYFLLKPINHPISMPRSIRRCPTCRTAASSPSPFSTTAR